jgi:hypothetical protein
MIQDLEGLTALVMAPDGLLVVAEDMFCLGGSFVGM